MNLGILLDDTTGDFDLSQGRLRLGDARTQTAEILLVSEQGELQEYPKLGLGVRQLLGSDATTWGAFMVRAKKQLRHCKLDVDRLYYDEREGKLVITYEFDTP